MIRIQDDIYTKEGNKGEKKKSKAAEKNNLAKLVEAIKTLAKYQKGCVYFKRA